MSQRRVGWSGRRHAIALAMTGASAMFCLGQQCGAGNLPIPVPPLCVPGMEQTVTDDDCDGTAEVTLLSLSYDFDGKIEETIWRENGEELAEGVNPTIDLAVGTHVINLRVEDCSTLVSTCDVTINVLPGTDCPAE